MNSLEKKMFFLPRKLFIKKDKLFMTFNLSVIPRDMEITLMLLYIPLPGFPTATKVYVKEIKDKWSKKSIKKGNLPPRSPSIYSFFSAPQEKLLEINVTYFREKWRLKVDENYGIYIRLKNRQLQYLEDDPPYLVLNTI